MVAVTALDATALTTLESLHAKLRHHKTHLILSGPHTHRYFLLEKLGFIDRVGIANVAGSVEAAVARARVLTSDAHS